MIRLYTLIFFLFLTSCAVPPAPVETSRATTVPLAPMNVFSAAPATSATPLRSNIEIAQDIMDLTFSLETGREVRLFTRFQGPITVGVFGDSAQRTRDQDLNALLARLGTEANLPISRTSADAADIRLEVVAKADLKKVAPFAACFVVPGNHTLESYVRAGRTRASDWTKLTQRTQATVFLPGDVSPQETRIAFMKKLLRRLALLTTSFVYQTARSMMTISILC